MAKLYFKYGAMGSSKTAQALITKFNYEERGMRVWLIKPKTDERDGENTLSSRVGLTCECFSVGKEDSIYDLFELNHTDVSAIIADECQFFTKEQIDDMRKIVDEKGIPVLCFGLRTDFLTNLFEGSRRLFEIADSIAEIKTICACGRKATINARIRPDGKIATEGKQVFIGGNESYLAMCHKCYKQRIESER